MQQEITEERRKEIFQALVEAQDQGASVSASRDRIASEYDITTEDVQTIEREGIRANWPPL